MQFKDYLSLEQFTKFYTFYNTDKTIDEAWRKEFGKIREDNFQAPFMEFMADKRENLLKIANSEGHLTTAGILWNNFVDGIADKYNRSVSDIFDKAFSYAVSSQDTSPDAIEASYEKINTLFTKGTFTNYQMPDDIGKCQECAQHMKLSFDNWSPKFMVFAKDEEGNMDYRNYQTPESCLPDQAIELKINFPSGQLLVADFIRIPELIEATKNPERYSDQYSLNSTLGCINTTKRYAQEFNFICVSLGNNSPHVYMKDGNLTVGHTSWNDAGERKKVKGYKEVAKVCTDFWGVTMIDKATLIDILKTSAGDRALDIVEQYMAQDIYGHDSVRVEPGDYTLRFHGDYTQFKGSDKKIETMFEVCKDIKPAKKIKM